MCQSSCDNPRSSFMEWSRTHNQDLSLVPTHFKAILPIQGTTRTILVIALTGPRL